MLALGAPVVVVVVVVAVVLAAVAASLFVSTAGRAVLPPLLPLLAPARPAAKLAPVMFARGRRRDPAARTVTCKWSSGRQPSTAPNNKAHTAGGVRSFVCV